MLPLDDRDAAFLALHREARERAGELGKKLGLPDEAVEQILSEVDQPGKLADLVAGYIDIPVDRAPGAARDALGRGPAAPRARARAAPDRRPLGAGRHPGEGQGGARRPAARGLPARAVEGHPEGARRRRGRAGRVPEGAQGEARRPGSVPGGPQGSGPGVAAPDARGPRVDGVAGHPHVPRDGRGAALEHAQRRAPGRSARPRASSTRTTTACRT